jgi:hypothetical protein
MSRITGLHFVILNPGSMDPSTRWAVRNLEWRKYTAAGQFSGKFRGDEARSRRLIGYRLMREYPFLSCDHTTLSAFGTLLALVLTPNRAREHFAVVIH